MIQIETNDKTYRRTRPPENGRVFGRWEFYFPLKNGMNWHDVKAFAIRQELDRMAAEQVHEPERERRA